MQIRLSRHAKRRIRLYRLPEDKIIELVQSQPVRLGQHEVITRVEGVALPVKIVYANEVDQTVVITAYPLKSRKYENLL
ncbi:MAG: hypothetical protein VX610_02660 [SAR324 cluster bacterium]|nr:hypothetical protein [SAR324 cluster bacterium]